MADGGDPDPGDGDGDGGDGGGGYYPGGGGGGGGGEPAPSPVDSSPEDPGEDEGEGPSGPAGELPTTGDVGAPTPISGAANAPQPSDTDAAPPSPVGIDSPTSPLNPAGQSSPAAPPSYELASQTLQDASESPLLIGPAGAPIDGAQQSVLTSLGGGESQLQTVPTDGPDGASNGWIKVENPDTGDVTAHYEGYSDGDLTIGTFVGHYDDDGALVTDYSKTYDFGTGSSVEQTFTYNDDGDLTSVDKVSAINGVRVDDAPAAGGQPFGDPDRPIIINPELSTPPAQAADGPPVADPQAPPPLPERDTSNPDAGASDPTLAIKTDAGGDDGAPSPPDEKIPDDRPERYASPPWDWSPPGQTLGPSQQVSAPQTSQSTSWSLADWMTRGGANVITGGAAAAFGFAGIAALSVGSPIVVPVALIAGLGVAAGIPVFTTGIVQLATSDSMSDQQQQQINKGTDLLLNLAGPGGLIGGVAGGFLDGEEGVERGAELGSDADKILGFLNSAADTLKGESSFLSFTSETSWDAIDQSKVVSPGKYSKNPDESNNPKRLP